MNCGIFGAPIFRSVCDNRTLAPRYNTVCWTPEIVEPHGKHGASDEICVAKQVALDKPWVNKQGSLDKSCATKGINDR